MCSTQRHSASIEFEQDEESRKALYALTFLNINIDGVFI